MGLHREPQSSKQFTTFGWQGIRLTVPSAWTLVFAQGNYEAGNARLADENDVRLEMRWQPAEKGQTTEALVDAYLRRVAGRARKDHVEIAIRRGLNLASPVGKDVESYRWVADQQVLAMLSRCRQCGRIVHLHLLGRPDEPLRGLARTVFASLDDHPEAGVLLWNFLDVEFASPAALPLAEKSLQAGCIRMAFGRRFLRLEFVRVSLAEVLLASRGLAQWFTEFHKKRLKRRSFEIRDAQVKGHRGIEVEGRPWLLVNPSRLFGRPRILRAACWHCDETNRILICSFDGSAAEVPAFQQALAGFRCCPKG